MAVLVDLEVVMVLHQQFILVDLVVFMVGEAVEPTKRLEVGYLEVMLENQEEVLCELFGVVENLSRIMLRQVDNLFSICYIV